VRKFILLMGIIASLWLNPVSAIHPDHVGQPYRPTVAVQEFEYVGVVTSFTCEVHRSNPMSGCTTFANGEKVWERQTNRAACPDSWMGETIVVEGLGAFDCVDTPARSWYGDSPHIDLFFNSYQEAINWGIQERGVTIRN